ncbi:MAG TPA: hypothetical protein VGG75_14140 [Trebonia sp.]
MPGTEDNPVLGPVPQQKRGLTRREKLFAGAMILLFVVLSAGTLISQQLQQSSFETTITTNHNANLQRQAAQSAAIEAKLCKTLKPLVPLAKLRAPAGDPASNPSRAFEQQLVIRLAPLAQLGSDIGCP